MFQCVVDNLTHPDVSKHHCIIGFRGARS